MIELIEVVFMARLELWDIPSNGGDHAGGVAYTLHNTLREHSSFLVRDDQKKL